MAAASFVWDDPFLIEDQLSEDERMIRDSAAAFAKAELLPRIQDAYLSETSEPELFRLMGQAGLLGVTLPEKYGAADASYVAYGLVAREVERIDSGYRSNGVLFATNLSPDNRSNQILRPLCTSKSLLPSAANSSFLLFSGDVKTHA